MPRAGAQTVLHVCARLVIFGALPFFMVACGRAPRVALPAGAGVSFPDSAGAYEQAVRDCRSIKSMTASLLLSGRAGSTKISARIDGGFAADPARMRLEGFPRIHFGGKPFFILVARAADATLLLTRDNRVLRDAPPDAIVEALAGVALSPDEMRALVSGCGLGDGPATEGRSYDHGWASVRVAAATIFLRRSGTEWRVAGARRGALAVEYLTFSGGRPTAAHLHTLSSAGVLPADLTIRISDVETGAALQNAVFTVDVPRDATPLTIDELRKAGPLGG